MIFGVLYFFRPKIYFWKRTPEKTIPIAQKKKTVENNIEKKQISAESLRELAVLLDSEGQQYDKGLEDVLKKIPVKK